MKYSKKSSISSLSEGDKIKDIFVVKIKRGISPYSKGFYFSLLLSDNSGRTLEYKYWGDKNKEKIKKIYDSIKPDSVVLIKGTVSSYKGKLQMASNDPLDIKVLKKGEYDEKDFIKPPQRDLDKMYSELIDEVLSVKNEKIKKLLKNIFEDPEIKEKFKNHPGGIEIHHNWSGGLLQHSLEVLEYCKLSLKLFPEMDKDLLIAGALLHDIGKLEELIVTSRIKGTNIGQMVGHIVLGCIYVEKKIDETGIDGKLKEKILHMMASHHGKLEYGAAKKPMFPEAIVLYYADEMSSKIAEIREFVRESKEETEDDFMYNRRRGYNIYLR